MTQKDLHLFRASPYAPGGKKQENKPYPKPHPSPPKGKEQHLNILKLSGIELMPLGEGRGRGFLDSGK